ncbi:MarR family winged helix-turn-helix transcriptional regulator [Winogradskya humida]|nr:MarR family transcriptional regulator [Actinoplanes humidus]
MGVPPAPPPSATPSATPSAPLSAGEERLWRAVMRLLFVLPRALDQDLQDRTGLNSSRYGVLFNLSEAPERTLRMNELAGLTALSASRMTRVVDSLEAAGYVRRSPAEQDGRGFLVTLTPDGLQRLQEAWPEHLRSARDRVMSHVSGSAIDVAALTELMEQIVQHSERPSATK